jgi:hypothetical protein
MDAVNELRQLQAEYAGRVNWYPKDNARGATARAIYSAVVRELDTRIEALATSAR